MKRNVETEKDERTERKDFDSFGEEIWFLGFHEDGKGVYLICHEDDSVNESSQQYHKISF